MLKNLSTTQISFIIILVPVSMWCIKGVHQLVSIENKFLDMIFMMFVFFAVPYIFVCASIPIVAFVQAIVNILKK